MATGVSGFSFSSFQAKYKYRIAGQDDSVFRAVGSLVKDDQAFRFLKSTRLTETLAIQNITATEPDLALRASAIAKTKINFVERASMALTKLNIEGKTSARSMAPGVSAVAKEIRTIVQDYTANTTDSATDQTAFLNRVQTQIDKLQRMALQLKPKLRAEGQYFNASLVAAKRALEEAETAITAHLGGGSLTSGSTTSSTSASAPPDSGGVDITV